MNTKMQIMNDCEVEWVWYATENSDVLPNITALPLSLHTIIQRAKSLLQTYRVELPALPSKAIAEEAEVILTKMAEISHNLGKKISHEEFLRYFIKNREQSQFLLANITNTQAYKKVIMKVQFWLMKEREELATLQDHNPGNIEMNLAMDILSGFDGSVGQEEAMIDYDYAFALSLQQEWGNEADEYVQKQRERQNRRPFTHHVQIAKNQPEQPRVFKRKAETILKSTRDMIFAYQMGLKELKKKSTHGFAEGDVVSMKQHGETECFRVVSVDETSVELMNVRVHIQELRNVDRTIPTVKVQADFFNNLNKLEVSPMGDAMYRSLNNPENPLRVYLNKLWTSTGLVFNCIKFKKENQDEYLLVYGRNNARQFFSILYIFTTEGHLKIPDGDVFFLLSNADAIRIRGQHTFLNALDLGVNAALFENLRLQELCRKVLRQKEYTFAELDKLLAGILLTQAQTASRNLFAYVFYDLHNLHHTERIEASRLEAFFVMLKKYSYLLYCDILRNCRIDPQEGGVSSPEVTPPVNAEPPAQQGETGEAEEEVEGAQSDPSQLTNVVKENIDALLELEWATEKILSTFDSTKKEAVLKYIESKQPVKKPEEEEEGEEDYELI